MAKSASKRIITPAIDIVASPAMPQPETSSQITRRMTKGAVNNYRDYIKYISTLAKTVDHKIIMRDVKIASISLSLKIDDTAAEAVLDKAGKTRTDDERLAEQYARKFWSRVMNDAGLVNHENRGGARASAGANQGATTSPAPITVDNLATSDEIYELMLTIRSALAKVAGKPCLQGEWGSKCRDAIALINKTITDLNTPSAQ